MSGFLVQFIGASLLFAVIETTDEVLRRVMPGKRNVTYALLKLAYGLPMVFIAGAWLFGLDGPIDWLAIALGMVLSATLALVFFSAPKEVSK